MVRFEKKKFSASNFRRNVKFRFRVKVKLIAILCSLIFRTRSGDRGEDHAGQTHLRTDHSRQHQRTDTSDVVQR